MSFNLSYYLWTTYRRKMLDDLQRKYQDIYRGVVLDVGGKDRGRFQKPKNKVKKWIFADIVAENNPDIVLDVNDMKNEINDESIDVVNAIELFEHVENPKKGLRECWRVLKKDGYLLIAAPFLYPIHADPNDIQRWTEYKWKIELNELGFSIVEFKEMGFFHGFGGYA